MVFSNCIDRPAPRRHAGSDPRHPVLERHELEPDTDPYAAGTTGGASLWIVGIGQALSSGGSWPLAGGALLLGLLVIVVGMTQSSLLVGPFHWVIQVVHLLLGILAVGVGQIAVHVGGIAAQFAKNSPAERFRLTQHNLSLRRRSYDTVNVRYIVRDVEEAIAFYTEHLGFEGRCTPVLALLALPEAICTSS